MTRSALTFSLMKLVATLLGIPHSPGGGLRARLINFETDIDFMIFCVCVFRCNCFGRDNPRRDGALNASLSVFKKELDLIDCSELLSHRLFCCHDPLLHVVESC